MTPCSSTTCNWMKVWTQDTMTPLLPRYKNHVYRVKVWAHDTIAPLLTMCTQMKALAYMTVFLSPPTTCTSIGNTSIRYHVYLSMDISLYFTNMCLDDTLHMFSGCYCFPHKRKIKKYWQIWLNYIVINNNSMKNRSSHKNLQNA